MTYITKTQTGPRPISTADPMLLRTDKKIDPKDLPLERAQSEATLSLQVWRLLAYHGPGSPASRTVELTISVPRTDEGMATIKVLAAAFGERYVTTVAGGGYHNGLSVRVRVPVVS